MGHNRVVTDLRSPIVGIPDPTGEHLLPRVQPAAPRAPVGPWVLFGVSVWGVILGLAGLAVGFTALIGSAGAWAYGLWLGGLALAVAGLLAVPRGWPSYLLLLAATGVLGWQLL